MVMFPKMKDTIYDTFQNCQREYGGILGGYDGIITEFILDRGLCNENIGIYIPDVEFLNNCIEKWQTQNISFYGIIHNHMTEYAELSSEDVKCIETIMNAMPSNIEYLYFPVISSKNVLNAFKATYTDKGICIVSEYISIIERSV